MLTDSQIERYSRQVILPEVGGRGQERLLASAVSIRAPDEAGELCAIYLGAAGVGTIAYAGPGRESVAEEVRARNPDCRVVEDLGGAPDLEIWIVPETSAAVLVVPPARACVECLRTAWPAGSTRAEGSPSAVLVAALLATECLRVLLGLSKPDAPEILEADLSKLRFSRRALALCHRCRTP